MEKEKEQTQRTLDVKGKIEKYFGRLDEATDERIIQWLSEEFGLTEDEVRNAHVFILKTDIMMKFITDCKLSKRDSHFNTFTISNRANAVAKRIGVYKSSKNKSLKGDPLPF